MFNKILIANRGEIACRVIKTASRLGVRSVAVYSDADQNALHVAMADEAIHIGAAPSQESYLVGERIIEAALQTGAEAIHPGYGFLSENPDFAQSCQDNKLIFIGPPVDAIKSMGSKSAAKTIMTDAQVPLVPGYHGQDQSTKLLKQAADDMRYPVLLKAVAGGGGKGMRQVWSADDFDQALTAAKREANSSFGNDHMLVEKYLTRTRHVEVQVFCDQQGNGVFLFERDCSVQRRHQKVIEEAPAPGLGESLRQEMGAAAVRAAQAIQYEGAGTVEFLLDPGGEFFFMEMNTRLQVEHPVTEMITGQDLVEWQLRVAFGEPLPMRQDQLKITGHAFEARIYAEDPDNDFMPTSGRLNHLQPPSENAHVRVDTGVIQGDEVSPYYDPMIAKLIVWDENRDRALTRLASALSQYHISGITNNIQFLYNLATSEPFKKAQLDTGFIENNQAAIFRQSPMDIEASLPLASLYLLLRAERVLQKLQNSQIDPYSPWNSVNGWRLNQPNMHLGAIVINGQSHDVPVEEISAGRQRRFRISFNDRAVMARGSLDGNTLTAEIDGHRQAVVIMPHQDHYTLFSQSGAVNFQLQQPDYGEIIEGGDKGNFTAPMNGTVIDVLVKAGASVEQGDPLVIMEAMKMQHTIHAPAAGTVSELFCVAGELVTGGAELLSFESTAPEG
ncbi:MAG: acetyl/propionyl/methylcrotonyl-CoA carboxylase subunit alpha [Gammaproteobacteria bacterium]|nr:acetyl/propionyl/methylcrotonyl-CoA carboxylase subunit alpha [Gammaproteobacteria bacterium]